MASHDGHRGWINHLAVDAARRGQRPLLMERAERRLSDVECPKINLQLRADNSVAAEFYERLGYTIDDVISTGRRLVDDTTPNQ